MLFTSPFMEVTVVLAEVGEVEEKFELKERSSTILARSASSSESTICCASI